MTSSYLGTRSIRTRAKSMHDFPSRHGSREYSVSALSVRRLCGEKKATADLSQKFSVNPTSGTVTENKRQSFAKKRGHSDNVDVDTELGSPDVEVGPGQAYPYPSCQYSVCQSRRMEVCGFSQISLVEFRAIFIRQLSLSPAACFFSSFLTNFSQVCACVCAFWRNRDDSVS